MHTQSYKTALRAEVSLLLQLHTRWIPNTDILLNGTEPQVGGDEFAQLYEGK
jgi:hypothetical protein